MFWFVLLGIAILGSIIFTIIDSCRNTFCWAGVIITLTLVTLGSFLACLLLGLSNILAYQIAEKELQFTHTYDLYALNDNTISENSVFLGTGTVSAKPVYYVLQSDSETSYQMKTYDINYVTLGYTDGQPRVEVYETYFVNPVVRFICGDYGNDEYKIYVPKGSIVQNYIVDLQ